MATERHNKVAILNADEFTEPKVWVIWSSSQRLGLPKIPRGRFQRLLAKHTVNFTHYITAVLCSLWLRHHKVSVLLHRGACWQATTIFHLKKQKMLGLTQGEMFTFKGLFIYSLMVCLFFVFIYLVCQLARGPECIGGLKQEGMNHGNKSIARRLER